MLDRIDIKNIFFSFGIGALIGLFSQIALNSVPDTKSVLLCILVSGIIGLVIGAVIEFIMALLPIKNARSSTYFIISNITALVITSVIILFLYFYGVENFSVTDLIVVLTIAFVIIIAANILDYARYKRTNRKLMEYIEKKNKVM